MPHPPLASFPAVLGAAGLLAACAGPADQPLSIGVGPDPQLPQPESRLIPTLKVAEATGWSGRAQPVAADGLAVAAFATGLDHPRWLYVLPNGDVLVAETNAPPRPEDAPGGIRGFFMTRALEKAGALTPSANRISLLRDADGDGVAETRSVFLENLNSPFGMAVANGRLYIAEADAIVSVPYEEGQTESDATPAQLTDLPGGPRNHHWTKNIVTSADGGTLYAAVGSNSNAGEHGMAEEEGRAAIWAVDAQHGEKRPYATGLRNPVGLDWNPDTGALWAAVNERDELGHNLVPDYITSVEDGAFYGWPYSYWGVVDERVEPRRPDLVASARDPDYALGAHTASLGLTFADGAALGARFADGAFVGQHGSWNRDPRSGYKVIFVPFAGGAPSGEPMDVLTGFLDGDEARGRPVGVAIARDGALLVADDVGNTIWRVTASGERQSLAEAP